MGERVARAGVARLAGCVVAPAAVVLALLAGCGPKAAEPAVAADEAEAFDLVFEDARVSCAERDGAVGGRYATFELTARVTNGTDHELSAKSMPTLASSGPEPTAIDCDLEPDVLAAGAGGTVSFEGMFDLYDEVVPVLGFSCGLSCAGLEDAQADLNAGLATIVAASAPVGAGEPAAADAREREREDGAMAMRGLVGSTAEEGLEAAKAAGYSPVFKDGQGVDVTARVKDPEDVTGVREAAIAAVDVSHGLILDSVSFTLDYTDPDGALERERAAAKAEADARAKAEAEAAGASVEEATVDVVVTVEDNDDFARLLAVEHASDPLVARFANAYEGRAIAFDARIVGVTPRPQGRVDLVLVAQPAEDAPHARAFAGPVFGLKGVGLESVGLAKDDTVAVGTTARVRARIVGLDDETSRIALSPIEVVLS